MRALDEKQRNCLLPKISWNADVVVVVVVVDVFVVHDNNEMSHAPICGARMALWKLSNDLPLIEIEDADCPVGAGEEGEEGVELVDTGEGGDGSALRKGGCLHQPVLGRLPRIGREPQCVHD